VGREGHKKGYNDIERKEGWKGGRWRMAEGRSGEVRAKDERVL
jgi:hypothetical protein